MFDGVDVRLSAYSYLVSLLPDRIVADLGLELRLTDRAVASYTAADAGRPVDGPAGRARRGAGHRHVVPAAHRLRRRVRRLAALLRPARHAGRGPRAHADRAAPRGRRRRRPAARPGLWHDLRERPLADVVADHLADDVVRGIALTDGLIGTFADVHAADGLAGRCFLYHLIGNGTGRWRVPVGGMGAVSGAMAAAARRGGAELVTRATVTALDPRADGVTVHWTDDDGTERAADAGHVVCGAAPTRAGRADRRRPRARGRRGRS